MKKVSCYLTIGYPGASHEDVLEFKDDATDAEIEQDVADWAHNYIEYGWTLESAEED